jgi:predicted acylesterase/phospholipase RssA
VSHLKLGGLKTELELLRPPMFLPKHLVFSGGGTRCLIYISVLKRLEVAGHLRNVQEWWGTSAGALIATLLAICRSPARVAEIAKEIDFSKFRDVSLLNVVNFTSAWGIDDGYALVSEIERILDMLEPGASRKTMAEISGLRIVVGDLNIYETVVCSDTTFPQLRVVDALRASMSLPIFYRPFRCPINSHIWVDGGIRSIFPWDCLPSDTARREALGFAFERPWIHGPSTFTEYIFSMMHFEDPKRIHAQKKDWPQNIIWFPSPPFPAWYVRLRDDDFELLEALGSKAFEGWQPPKPLPSPVKTSQIPRSSEGHHTPSQEFPAHHTGGTSEIPPPCPSPSQAPSQDPPPRTPRSSRRWSL